MKTLTTTWSILFASLVMLTSCEDEAIIEQTNRIAVQFETARTTIAENAGVQNVTVTFNKPLSGDAELRLKVDNTFMESFETSSSIENGLLTIEIAKGDNEAVLQVTPVDNAEKDGQRVVKLQIHDLSIPFRTGTNPGLEITIMDDESTNTTYSLANFVEQTVTLQETNTTAIEYQVHFSDAVALDSEIKIALNSDKGAYGLNYVSEPAAHDNVLTLPVNAGSRVVSFSMRTVDNEKISGDVSVELSIIETSGSIRKGHKLQQALTIKDDELYGKPRGYEVTAGSTILKKSLEYDEHGRVTKVHWESYNPYNSQWTETYYYDSNGNIQRVEKYPGKEVRYHWSNGRITRSESFINNVQQNYTDYDYDDLGNLAGAAPYYRQNNGAFVRGLYTIYFYFQDGNLYKSLTFQDSNDPENPTLISTRTYENYIDVENPFPMTEVLPNVNMQTKLPTTYRIEESGTDFTYHMTYEFGENGRPEKRIATSSNDTQTAVYHYY